MCKKSKYFVAREDKILKHGCPICGGVNIIFSQFCGDDYSHAICEDCGGEGIVYEKMGNYSREHIF